MGADGWRLAVGTLTAFPVRPPTTVRPRAAMLRAPLAVLPLAAGAVAVVWLVPVPPLAVGLLVVGMLALGTRALHWDGLSDVADGLTASYERERSLAVMKTGTSGPAGTVAVVVVAGLQAAALSAYAGTLVGGVVAGLLVCLSRCALWLVCCARVPPAREDGLGAGFTGVVPVPVAVVGTLLLSVVGGLVVWLLIRRTTARFGGVTGDVMGAAIELALATTLLVWSCAF
ncbi:MAG TPA: adenosylcobinamide-GDP ribazoletransferase [Nocardioides bacterium]|nr:adenosylcobinamide-GDP ribazoletransferase [uncultured Nocardioides sp.]HCB04906.1 adenosylcobinamide-GDP ribazoletransferase [Nocardioides sp.]